MFFIVVLFIAIIFVILIFKIYRNHTHLNHIPKPPCSVLLGHLKDFMDLTKILQTLTDYTLEYGGLIRIYIPPVKPSVLVTDAEVLKIILTSSTEVAKAKDYHLFQPWLGSGLVLRDANTWKCRRRMLTPCFGRLSLLKHFTKVFDSFGDILIEKLKHQMNDQSLNVFPLIKMYSLDVICETSMGVCINAQENVSGIYVKSIEQICQLVMNRFIIPYKRFDFIYRFTEDYLRLTEAIKIIDSFFCDLVKSKKKKTTYKNRKNSDEQRAFLDLLLKINEEDETFTINDVRDEVNNFLFGGHDTTATGIAFTLYALSRHPKIQEQVIEEQINIFGKLKNIPASYEDLQSMKYLELVIYEALRLYPPIPAMGRRIIEDIDLGKGVILPKNLNISIFIYGCHHNPKYFPEPEKFKPERFEGNNIKPFTFLGFSLGPRNCIGKKFAMLQMKSCISKIIRKFELHPSIPDYTLELIPQISLVAKNGIRLSFKERIM